jgi:2-hydroxychromene-2-carboxylate isomerase
MQVNSIVSHPKEITMRTLDFWFEYGSTYTYLTVARIRTLAQSHSVSVSYRPFLLLPLLVEQGMNQGPFLPYPRKIDYMWRDLARRAAEHGIPYAKPSLYPPHDVLTTARLGVLGAREGWCEQFTEKVFNLHWTENCIIGTEENIRAALEHIALDPASTIERARRPENKEALKSQTEEAMRLGLFGSPSFLVAGELFWGDDRLEQAIEWAKTH